MMTVRYSRMAFLVSLALLVAVFQRAQASAAAGSAPPQKAVGSVELKAPVAPLEPINTCCPASSQPAVDVSALSIRSDGTRITFAATLKDPPGVWATTVVTIYVDSDNNPATGLKPMPGINVPGGFEYEADLTLCIKYANGSQACIGGSEAKPTERTGAVKLQRFKDDTTNNTDTVVDAMGFPGRKPSVRVPVAGQVVESSIDYADLNVKPGQTIRLLATKSGGGGIAPVFPIVLLTLK